MKILVEGQRAAKSFKIIFVNILMWCFYCRERVHWTILTWFCHNSTHSLHFQIVSENLRITIIRWLVKKTSFERHHRSVGFMTNSRQSFDFKQIRIIYEERVNVFDVVEGKYSKFFNYTIASSFLSNSYRFD